MAPQGFRSSPLCPPTEDGDRKTSEAFLNSRIFFSLAGNAAAAEFQCDGSRRQVPQHEITRRIGSGGLGRAGDADGYVRQRLSGPAVPGGSEVPVYENSGDRRAAGGSRPLPRIPIFRLRMREAWQTGER
jgi:hypothetical protein